MNSFYLKIAMFMIMFTAINLAAIAQHEQAHVQIYEQFDVVSDWHYQFSIFTPAYTQAINGTEEYENCKDTCKSLHAQNEIVGYNVFVIWGVLMALFFLYTIYKEIDKIEEKYG